MQGLDLALELLDFHHAFWPENWGAKYIGHAVGVDTAKPYMSNINKSWTATLRRAGIQHFSLYELRHTFATRLSAGGVADRFVAQALRQDDPAVFKRYSQAKLQMLRHALGQLDRRANERAESLGTATQN